MITPFGHYFADKLVTFKVWAPKCKTVELELRNSQPNFQKMTRSDDGFHEITVDDVKHGDPYRLRIDGKASLPDPAGHAFENNVHGWNLAVDQNSWEWRCDQWQGIPKRDLVIYELHIGTFTQQGTFASAKARIGELKDLGVNAIELLPLAQCPGKWNWGYDGVGIWAVQNTYGTPDQFKDFVDHCHELGIAVILDVVFNHLGPEGNYLSQFGPFFTRKRKTPWGDALNFDGNKSEFVRDFMAQCAVHWIRNYRLDGLRMDAVHFMFDDSEVPISMKITQAIDEQCSDIDWPIHLIGETNVCSTSLTRGTSRHGTGFDAVWVDCMMHSVLGVAQPGLDLCHREHRGAKDVAQSLHQGFIHENFPYERNDAGERGDLESFVIGFQNHDTVGNHPLGLRIHQLGSVEFQMAAAALYLLYPAIPMIFMGEEFAAESPFLFFVDFKDPWVRDGVEKGRAAEYPELSNKLGGLSPLAEKSFFNSKLQSRSSGSEAMWNWYQSLIRLRKEFQTSGVLDQHNLSVSAKPEFGLFELSYSNDGGASLSVAVRLCESGHNVEPCSFAAKGKLLIASDNVRSDEATKTKLIGPNQALVFTGTGV